MNDIHVVWDKVGGTSSVTAFSSAQECLRWVVGLLVAEFGTFGHSKDVSPDPAVCLNSYESWLGKPIGVFRFFADGVGISSEDLCAMANKDELESALGRRRVLLEVYGTHEFDSVPTWALVKFVGPTRNGFNLTHLMEGTKRLDAEFTVSSGESWDRRTRGLHSTEWWLSASGLMVQWLNEDAVLNRDGDYPSWIGSENWAVVPEDWKPDIEGEGSGAVFNRVELETIHFSANGEMWIEGFVKHTSISFNSASFTIEALLGDPAA